jgi:hypothetical protein
MFCDYLSALPLDRILDPSWLHSACEGLFLWSPIRAFFHLTNQTLGCYKTKLALSRKHFHHSSTWWGWSFNKWWPVLIWVSGGCRLQVLHSEKIPLKCQSSLLAFHQKWNWYTTFSKGVLHDSVLTHNCNPQGPDWSILSISMNFPCMIISVQM